MPEISTSPENYDKSFLSLEAAGFIATAINKNGIITDINSKGCAVLDRVKEDINGKPFFSIFTPVNAMLAAGVTVPERCETTIMLENGKSHLFEWQTMPLLDKENNITGFLCFGNDITDLRRTASDLVLYNKRLEEAMLSRISELIKANEKLKFETRNRRLIEERLNLKTTVIEKAAEAILVLDQKGRIKYVNEALIRTLKYSRSELLALNFRQLFPSGELSLIENALNSLEPDKKGRRLNTKQVCRDGTIISAGIYFVSLSTHFGPLIMCEITDIAGSIN